MAKNKKRKKNNQDVVSLFIFFSVIALVVVGMAWLDRAQSFPDEFEGGASSVYSEETEQYDGILVVATVTAVGIFGALVIKKLINNARKKKIEKDKLEKLKQLLEMQKHRRDNNIDQILAAGRRTVDSRNYHKNFYRNRQEQADVIDIKEERLRNQEEEQKISDMLDEHMYKDYHKKNLSFYISLGGIIFISLCVIIAILLF